MKENTNTEQPQEESTSSRSAVERLVSCVDDVTSKFTDTGETTPAGFKSYVHPTLDMCAKVAKHRTKAIVYFRRKVELVWREKLPCFYEDSITLDR